MKKILVVDDEFELAMSVESILLDEGHEVIRASDGLEAFELFKTQSFDLVLSDVMMPRLDGYGLMERIRSEGKSKIPVILMSAADLKAAGNKADGFLKKPFDLDALIDTVEGFLKKS